MPARLGGVVSARTAGSTWIVAADQTGARDSTLVTVVRFIEPESDFHRLARFLEEVAALLAPLRPRSGS